MDRETEIHGSVLDRIFVRKIDIFREIWIKR